MHVNSRISSLLEALNNPSLPGIDLSLDRMVRLLAELGNPQDRLPPVIHLAGTNGKGSTLAFLRAIYQAAGYRVHAYTSPHLVRFNERIVLAGEEITNAVLEPLLERIHAAARDIPVTFFEATTAAALLAFAEHAGDVVLLETGLGGRLDATNVVAAPALTVITPIGLDHMEFLGPSIEGIATEKAGIIKAGVPCIVGAQDEPVRKVIARVAYQKKASLLVHGVGWEYGRQEDVIHVTEGLMGWDLPLPSLPGAHQLHNAALASMAVRHCTALSVTEKALQAGIRWAKWPGRLQHLTHGPLVEAWGKRGDVYLDGGHNVHAAHALAAWISAQSKPVTLVCGMMARKDAAAFFAPLVGKVAEVVTIGIPGHDSYTAEALADAARQAGITKVRVGVFGDPSTVARSRAAGVLLLAGSLFLVGELLKNHG